MTMIQRIELALRAVKARRDDAISDAEFVAMLLELPELEAPIAPLERAPDSGNDGSTGKALGDENETPPASRRRLSFDDRTRIRKRFQDARDASSTGALPRGFAVELANEYGVSRATIDSIGNNRDEP